MKRLFVFAGTVLMLGTAAAFDLNNAQPGVQFSTQKPDELREALFTDAKPVKKLFVPGKKNAIVKTFIEINPKHELVIKPENGDKEAKFAIRLNIPKMEKFQLSFSIKADSFFARNKSDRKQYNRMSIYAGGVNLMLRGDTRDLRYFDGTAKKYVRGAVTKNGEWLDVTIDAICGAAPKFSFNGKTDILQRGKCENVRVIAMSGEFLLAKPDTVITIKNLKITPLP
ncbi:MAG: hypothetical protein IKA71_08360 [Lentisphaeria bacterium]|nr:hypothetical protein [Lentisphaeria bacterium]